MKYFKFKLSSETQGYLDKVLSSILPHENFDVTEASSVVENLFRTVPIEETYGTNYVMFKIFNKMSLVKRYLANYDTILRQDVYESALATGIANIIGEEQFNAKQFFAEYGKHFDMSVPKELEEAIAYAYSLAMERYEELFEMAIPTAEAFNWLNMLKDSMEHDLTTKMVSITGQILTSGYAVEGKVYKGSADARQLLELMMQDVKSRISEARAEYSMTMTVEPVRSYEEHMQFRERNNLQSRPLYYTGFDPVDDLVQVSTQDIFTIVGDEGIGKTNVAVGQGYEAITQGCNVLFICGESSKTKIEHMLLAAHLFTTEGIALTWKELRDPSTIKIDDVEKLEQITIKINASIHDFLTRPEYGRPFFVDTLYYETYKETIIDNCQAYGIDIVITDHVAALSSNGQRTNMGYLSDLKTRVEFLALAQIEILKVIDIAFINLTHPSVEASKELKQGKTPGARSSGQSSGVSKGSSIVIVLGAPEAFKPQGLLLAYVTKTREFAPITEPMVLQKQSCTCKFVYDPKLQHLAKGSKTALGEADLEDLYTDDME